LFLALQRHFQRNVEGTPFLPSVDGRQVFDSVLVALSWRWARTLERWLGTRRLQTQLRWLVVVAIFAALWPAYRLGIEFGTAVTTPFEAALAMVWVIGGACAIGAAYNATFRRLAALVLAGGAGLATCLTFVWFSAPDLALTQLLVEVVTTVLLLLGLRWLPKRNPYASTRAGRLAALPRRSRDLAIAVCAGGGLSALAYAVMTRPLPDTVSRFFVQHAYSEGGGTNVVNVILVDFRGFDTLGEIAVLGAVAVAAYSLLRRFRPARESMKPPPGRL